MRAYAVQAFGEPPGICDPPVPAAEESVLVRVSYAGVNPVDIQLADQLTSASAFPFVLGVDVAGVVELRIFDFELPAGAMSRLDALDRTGGTSNAIETRIKWW